MPTTTTTKKTGRKTTTTKKTTPVSEEVQETVESSVKEVKKEKQKRLNDIKKEAKNKIATKVDNCIDVIYEIALKSKDTRTKFQAAKYLCDQFIGSPTAEKTEKEEENNKITVCLEDDDIDNMMNRIEEHRTGADID